MPSPGEKYWFIYKLFHDPPGKPKELKCVGCKVVAGTGTLALAGGMFAYTRRLNRTNGYQATVLFFASCAMVCAGATFLRLAYDHNSHNVLLQKEFEQHLRKERRALREAAMKQQDESNKVEQNVA